MTGYQNPLFNPYGFMQPYQQPQAPTTQVTRVHGENGARAYTMGPNSSALLLDESGLMVWLVTSDGASYKSVTAYDIIPHQEAQAPDYGTLENRISRLEEIVNGNTGNSVTTRKSKSGDAKRPPDDGDD